MTDQQRLVRVNFRKQVSDGNYGTEAAEVTLEWLMTSADTADEDQMQAATMLVDARDLVHGELGRSPSTRVRQALQPPKAVATSNARGGDEDPF